MKDTPSPPLLSTRQGLNTSKLAIAGICKNGMELRRQNREIASRFSAAQAWKRASHGKPGSPRHSACILSRQTRAASAEAPPNRAAPNLKRSAPHHVDKLIRVEKRVGVVPDRRAVHLHALEKAVEPLAAIPPACHREVIRSDALVRCPRPEVEREVVVPALADDAADILGVEPVEDEWRAAAQA